jgi:hypothetical protein
MEQLLELVNPQKQNSTQRIGFWAGLAIIALCVLIHFPFDGYDNEHLVTTYRGYGKCPSSTSEQSQNMTAKELDQYIQDLKRCTDKREFQKLPFEQWKSKGAVFSWFSSPTHTIAVSSFVFCLTMLWLWVFKDNEK